MNITIDMIESISNKYGDAFYLLDSQQFEENFKELTNNFKSIYPKFKIAYSYKTNYTPKLCKIIDANGGLAEVVSDMECDIALKIGVKPEKIIFNGPYKKSEAVENLLLKGGIVNIDSVYELQMINEIAKKNPQKQINVGIRCNFDVNDGVTSRFGFDINGEEFLKALEIVDSVENIKLVGLHCHFATRSIEIWPNKVEGILNLIRGRFMGNLEFVSVGGGLFGKMEDSLKKQFDYKIPSYEEYANVVATKFADFYKGLKDCEKPTLIIEPGSALVGDAMKFVSRVINIKDIRGKKIATLAGSIYNINPTLNTKNPPISVYHSENNENLQQEYNNLDFGGYTCIESDYLYKNFSGRLSVGDYVVFGNVGSYSVVLKPPFILPNFAIVDYNEKNDVIELIKEKETFDDIFKTFKF